MPPRAVVISIPIVASCSAVYASVMEGMIPPMATVMSIVSSPALDSMLSLLVYFVLPSRLFFLA